MKELDHEHKSFEGYAKNEGLNREMHPLHLLYLDPITNHELSVFKAGYSAGKEHLTDLQAQNEELRAKIKHLESSIVEAMEAMIKEEQSLADIRADAVIKAANAVVRHNECGFCLHCLLIDHANKIKGAE